MNTEKKATEGNPTRPTLVQTEKDDASATAPASTDQPTADQPTHDKVRTEAPEVSPEEAGEETERIDQQHADQYPGTSKETERELPTAEKHAEEKEGEDEK